MILLIDVGNSRIKWNVKPSLIGAFVGPTVSVPWSYESLLSLCGSHWQSLHGQVTQVLVSSVAGQVVQQNITQWVDKHLGLNAVFVQTQPAQLGVDNGYQDHRQLGVDRWLAILAAHNQWPDEDVILLGCGTAITFDAVTRQGAHLAGPIIPGKTLMINSLIDDTADIAKAINHVTDSLCRNELPTNDMPTREETIPNASTNPVVRNTQDAIVTGVHFTVAYAVRDIISALTVALSTVALPTEQGKARASRGNITLIVSGGGASSILPMTGIENYQLETDIVLQGLALVAASEI